MPRLVVAMSRTTWAELMTPALVARLRAVASVDLDIVIDDFSGPGAAAAVQGCEVLLTGWGAPRVDVAALDLMPDLRAIVHAAGTVKHHLTTDVFTRGIQVAAAVEANAIPVAEFTFAAIVLAAKRATWFAREYRTRRDLGVRRMPPGAGQVGANGIVVGVVGASRVGRLVLDRLRSLDARVLVYDPYLADADAAALGAELAGLDRLVRDSDIVTLHAPALPETRNMIGRAQLTAMRDGAVLINTSRGALVDTGALIAELASGRIEAVLDVTEPEPLPPDSPLFDLPNVQLTPHIAGALGNEVPRLLEQAVAEIERLAAGQPLAHPVVAADLERIA
ncbi:MAG TPA: hydroxyacid dehydrogenase [Streptosporangiaceae bacterium]